MLRTDAAVAAAASVCAAGARPGVAGDAGCYSRAAGGWHHQPLASGGQAAALVSLRRTLA